jgi:hypothetical protein
MRAVATTAPSAATPPAPGTDAGLQRGACRLLAWAICLGVILATGSTAFRTVEWHARAAFRARFGRPGEPMVDVRDLVGVVRLADGAEVEQAFHTDRDHLDGLQLRTVNWKTTPVAADCRWRLEVEQEGGAPRRVLRTGRIDPRRAGDWSFLEIGFPALPDSSRQRLVLVVSGPADDPGAVMGLPLFNAAAPHPPAVVRAAEGPLTGCLHLMLLHPGAAP